MASSRDGVVGRALPELEGMASVVEPSNRYIAIFHAEVEPVAMRDGAVVQFEIHRS
jgi:hypothetical protein